jgi:hypothetical protein
MAQQTTIQQQTCLIPTFERNRYFFGKPMTVRDFEAEQQYVINKTRLLNRLIHGVGILCGMQVSLPLAVDGKFKVNISEGAALDCCGNLIIVNRLQDGVEVQGGGFPEGTYYLYVKFAECVRQPIMASANVSSCEEVCSYNRIRETFEVFATREPPVTNSAAGNVEPGLTVRPPVASVSAAKAKAALVSPQPTAVVAPPPSNVRDTLCNEAAQKYFDEHSSSCPRCDDPRVFLAVINIAGGKMNLNPDETRRIRSVVFTNPMLQDLLCDHLADFNNPHHTTAAQVKALQNINGVGNVPGKDFVAGIKIVPADSTISIEDDLVGNKIKIRSIPANSVEMVGAAPRIGTASSFARGDHVHTLADDLVRQRHLNPEMFSQLVFSSDNSIKVQAGAGADNRRIDVTTERPPQAATNPAKSVALEAGVGGSENYAREDHVHDIAERAVEWKHLNDDVFRNLLFSSDGSVTVTPPQAGISAIQRRIELTIDKTKLTQPGDSVRSVASKASPGRMETFAREDHVHDLRINGVGPDGHGDLKLAEGTDITIQMDVENHVLTINSTASKIAAAGPAFRVTTGLVRFDDVRGGEPRPSAPIGHGLDARNFAIVLGLETTVGKTEQTSIEIGDLGAANLQNPRLVANYEPGASTFVIALQDQRQRSDAPTTYLVRWWAIPSTDEIVSDSR